MAKSIIFRWWCYGQQKITINKIRWHLLFFFVSLTSVFYLQIWELQKFFSLEIPITSSVIELPLLSMSVAQKATAITVKVISEEFWGSGILIGKEGNIYTVLTNAHVVAEDNISYQIQTPDGKLYATTKGITKSLFDDYDLALLTFVSDEKYVTASLGRNPQQGEKVVAVGFPFSWTNPEEKGIAHQEGVVWQMLPKSMEDGYQLGYSSQVQKGMSGGAVVNLAGEVVAVNGMHPYPLWGNPYVYQDGDIPDEKMLEEMTKYSWGIPIDTVKELIKQEKVNIQEN